MKNFELISRVVSTTFSFALVAVAFFLILLCDSKMQIKVKGAKSSVIKLDLLEFAEKKVSDNKQVKKSMKSLKKRAVQSKKVKKKSFKKVVMKEKKVKSVEAIAEKVSLPPNSLSHVKAMIISKDMKDSVIAKLIELIRENKYYPRMAQRRGVKGIVRVKIAISSSGIVENYKIIKSGHRLLSKGVDKTMSNVIGSKIFKKHAKRAFAVSIPIKFKL